MVNVAPGFLMLSWIVMLLASGVESGIIRYPSKAIITESKINISPATAILLRLNAFQVRCDGVNSAKCYMLDQLAKYRLFRCKNKVLSHYTAFPDVFPAITHEAYVHKINNMDRNKQYE